MPRGRRSSRSSRRPLRKFESSRHSISIYRGSRGNEYSVVRDLKTGRTIRRPEIHMWRAPKYEYVRTRVGERGRRLRLETYRNTRTGAEWMQCRNPRTGRYVRCPWVKWEYRCSAVYDTDSSRGFTITLRGVVRNTMADISALNDQIPEELEALLDSAGDRVGGYSFLYEDGFTLDCPSQGVSIRSPTVTPRSNRPMLIDIEVIEDQTGWVRSFQATEDWEWWL